MRRGALAFAVVATLGVFALLATAATDRRELAFTLGVAPAKVAATLPSGSEVCQGPIDVPTGFDRVVFPASTAGTADSVRVTIRGESGRTLVASATAPMVRPGPKQTVALDSVPSGERVSVCLRNLGREPLTLYGGGVGAARSEASTSGGKPLDADLSLAFERGSSKSMLSDLPATFERATAFHAGWIGAWTYWVLLVLLIAGVPALLAYALRDVDRE